MAREVQRAVAARSLIEGRRGRPPPLSVAELAAHLKARETASNGTLPSKTHPDSGART